MKQLAIVLVLVACSRPQYLGAPLPEPCRSRDIDGCLGWMVERDLIAAELGVYEDSKLRRYVQGVVDRLAHGTLLARAPRVVISDRDGTYATVGGRIVVARPTLERLDSEAELAGVLAHEMVHIEGRHTVASLYGPQPDEHWYETRRDAEAIADERAVVLLERAGYAPVAMGRALRSVLLLEDEEHPLRADRIARVDALARGRTGFEGRDELLRELEHMVVGRDTRLGQRIGDAWVIAALGIAVPLDDDVVRAADDLLVIRRAETTLTGFVIGAPWARELIAGLHDREVGTSSLGRVTAGTVPRHVPHDDSPLGKLQRAIRGSLPQPTGGARVAILERPRGALVLEIGGQGVPELRVRAATAAELAEAEPPRIALSRAPRRGAIASLSVCTGRLLDDPARIVAAGELIKCADQPFDRWLDRSRAPAPTTASLDRSEAETPLDE